MLEAWEKRHGEKAAVAMLRQLVLALRVWRPDVVVTDVPTDDTAQDRQRRASQGVRGRGRRGGVPGADQGRSACSRGPGGSCSSALDKADPTAVKADLTSPLPRLGDTAKELRRPRRSGCGATTGDVPGFRLVATRLKDAEGTRKFFDGIALAPGGAARRELPVR